MGSNMTEAGLYYLYQPLYGIDKAVRLYRVPMTELFCEDMLSGNYAAVQPVELTQELPMPESMCRFESLEAVLMTTEICRRFFQGREGDLYYLTFDTEQGKNYLKQSGAGRRLGADRVHDDILFSQ